LLIVGRPVPARAADPPPSEQLQALERQAAESRARAAALAQRMEQLRQDIETQRRDLTAQAAAVQDGEKALSALDAEQASLRRRIADASAALGADRQRLGGLTAGLVRLVRTPPGGLLAWPGAPIDAARGEVLLQAALNSVRDRAGRAAGELAELTTLERTLDDKRREGERAAADLDRHQADLALLIDKRQALYETTESDRRTEEAKAAAIAAQARDLRDLMARIEAQQQAEARRKASLHAAPPKPGPFVAAHGLPVAGEVKIRYGRNDGLGTTSHGITVRTRPGATVTAPAAGLVRFAGPFRSYREILILEHPGGYHSLIAGMSRIDVALGASVGAGEPVGTMDDRPAAMPELYYELRRNGQPVDPGAATLSADGKGTSR
jgi:septal ring factor EnvC (AmiA/AmiB activator)